MFRSDELAEVGWLSILFAEGEKPLTFWDKQVRTGRIKRIREEQDKGTFSCIELTGVNVTSTFISSPPQGTISLGITLPVLVLIVKNLKKYFFCEIQILDDKKLKRRFRLTNIPGFHRRQHTICTCPLVLDEGWNELSVNLADLCSRSFGSKYVETVKINIHANCRLREVFFCQHFDAMKVKSVRHFDSLDSNGPTGSKQGLLDEQLTRDRNRNITSSNDISSRFGAKEAGSTIRNDPSDSKLLQAREGRSEIPVPSSHLSLGQILKRDMYFEKKDDSSSTSTLRSPSKSRKK